ncbi:hypothetical protein [Bosea sp. (in: a-proteobacteria)]|jgi:phage-related minor tail protein|uniref:hypothetical protein n=1 Tax=Bosea sp. (in: a-proteobacteria) TaxID=1871050 RepID=UPI003F6E8C0C
MATRGLSPDEIKRRAQLAFDKADQRKQEASRAFEAERIEREAVAQKTARLRALRLAKESADAEAAATLAAEQARAKAALIKEKALAKAAKTAKTPPKKKPAKSPA